MQRTKGLFLEVMDCIDNAKLMNLKTKIQSYAL